MLLCYNNGKNTSNVMVIQQYYETSRRTSNVMVIQQWFEYYSNVMVI